MQKMILGFLVMFSVLFCARDLFAYDSSLVSTNVYLELTVQDSGTIKMTLYALMKVAYVLPPPSGDIEKYLTANINTLPIGAGCLSIPQDNAGVVPIRFSYYQYMKAGSCPVTGKCETEESARARAEAWFAQYKNEQYYASVHVQMKNGDRRTFDIGPASNQEQEEPLLPTEQLRQTSATEFSQSSNSALQQATKPVKSSSKDPIDLATGNMVVKATDMSLPARGPRFEFARTYNSQDNTARVLGYGWRHGYEIALTIQSDNNVVEWDANGSGTLYTKKTDGTYTASAGKDSKLTKNADGSFTITRTSGEKQEFSATGQLTKVTDRNSNSIFLGYDSAGVLSYIEDAAARRITTTVSNGRITQLTDPAGRSVTYAYSSTGDLTSITDAAGNVVAYTYDANHNITEMTNANGHITHFTYDDKDRAVSNYQDGDVNKETLSFDSATQTTLTDALGNKTVYTFNEYGLTTAIKDAQGQTTAISYTADMKKNTVTDAAGNVTTFAYNTNKQLTSVTDATGQATTFTYEPTFGFVSSITDALGNVTTYDYDSAGNPVKVTDALGNETTYTYDAYGNRTASTDPRGNTIACTYDTNGNVLTATDALGKITTFAYDASGNLLTVTDALGRVTTNTYDALGRKLTSTLPDTAVFSLSYDAFGHVTKSIDPLKQNTQYAFDAFERLTSVTDPQSLVVSQTYDAAGHVLTKTDAAGHSVGYTYDALGRVTQKSDALSHTVTYAYDALGRVSSTTDENAATISYAYNAAGDLTSETYPDATSVTFTYDALHRRTGMTDATGTTTYAYDALGRVTSIDGSASADTFTYAYDANGNRVSMIDPDNRTTTYAYDADNRLITMTAADGTVTYAYDAVGNLVSMTYPNGTVTAYTYDNNDRMTKEIVSCRGTACRARGHDGDIYSASLTYDLAGRLTKKTAQDATWIEYTYDASGRLLKETRKSKSGKSSKTLYTQTYSYDAAGNRTGFTRPVTLDQLRDRNDIPRCLRLPIRGCPRGLTAQWVGAYTYDNANRLLSWTKSLQINAKTFTIKTVAYEYDAHGNRTKQTETDADGQSSVTTYTYDPLYQLIAVGSNSGSRSARTSAYTYNGAGQQIKSSDGRHVTQYLYDGSDVTLERGEGGATQASYLRTLGVAGGIGGLVSRTQYRTIEPKPDVKDEIDTDDADAAADLDTPDVIAVKTEYYHADAQGNVIATTNARGRLNGIIRYDAYGRIVGQCGDLGASPYRYSTKPLDKTTGLYNFGARWYDPSIGRWLTPDPAGDIDGMNRYAFVRNSPVNYVDPWGLCAEKESEAYVNFFGHASVTTVIDGRTLTVGFGPDPDLNKMFDVTQLHLWPIYSPGLVQIETPVGVHLMVINNRTKVEKIRTAQEAALKNSNTPAYSVLGIECVTWAYALMSDDSAN